MEKEFRIRKLDQLKKEEKSYMTGIKIWYQGETRSFDAYKIPLEYLIYNKYNGRMGSLVKSYERQNHNLNAEDENDKELIEQFLYESKVDRNEHTLLSLVEEGQKQYGIVTNDGVIIDGNRRAMLLNKIFAERQVWELKKHKKVDNCKYFIAVILPEGADPREIIKLETTYQMGEDSKVDYNAIEKYLRCKDLFEVHKFKEWEIAKMMGEKEGKVKEYLQIMKLMDRYLDYLGYQGIYTRLEKREGHFVDLDSYLERYSKKNKSAFVAWDYDDIDVAELEAVCFDYIRAQYEGKEFRFIAQPSKKDGIFCQEKVWQQFLSDHKKTVNQNEEKTVEELIQENSDTDLSSILRDRDQKWAEKIEGSFKKNMNIAKRRLDDINEANEPLILVKRALDTLLSINTESDSFFDENVDDLLKKINQVSYDYRKIIKEERKS